MCSRTRWACWPARSPDTSANASTCNSTIEVAVILVVEDDPQVARLIALVLQRSGYQSQIVSDGQSALQEAKAKRPSMIFADLTIKGMGGDALCDALKKQPETKEIPYIVVSGDRDIADKARQC